MTYERPSGYILKKLTLTTNEGKTIGLEYIFSTIKIVEDIYSNFVYGELMFEDVNDLQQIAPLIGEETINFVYKTDNEATPEISKVFKVYKVDTTQDHAEEKLAHTLFFVSPEALENSNQSLSKSYKNKSLNFIIKDAYSYLNSDKKLTMDSYKGVYHIITPYWNPFQIINHLASIGRSGQYKTHLNVFYENSEGFNFYNIETLLSKNAIGTWTTRQREVTQHSPGDEIYPSYNIVTYRIIKNSVDTMKSITTGLYANEVSGYDNITKTIKKFEYNYKKDFNSHTHLSKFKLNSDNFQYDNKTQRLSYVPTTSYRYKSPYHISKMGDTNLSERREEVIPSRTSVLSQVSGKQMELDVHGNTNITAGVCINIEIYNNTALVKRKPQRHRYNTKKVLVTKVVNIFTTKQHEMKLLVMDDSYPNELTAEPEFTEATNA